MLGPAQPVSMQLITGKGKSTREMIVWQCTRDRFHVNKWETRIIGARIAAHDNVLSSCHKFFLHLYLSLLLFYSMFSVHNSCGK